MRIGNSGQPIRPQQHTAHASPPKANTDGKVSHVDAASNSIDLKTIESLGIQVANSLEVREAIVERVKEKLQNEDYLARGAAVATAKSILKF